MKPSAQTFFRRRSRCHPCPGPARRGAGPSRRLSRATSQCCFFLFRAARGLRPCRGTRPVRGLPGASQGPPSGLPGASRRLPPGPSQPFSERGVFEQLPRLSLLSPWSGKKARSPESLQRVKEASRGPRCLPWSCWRSPAYPQKDGGGGRV